MWPLCIEVLAGTPRLIVIGAASVMTGVMTPMNTNTPRPESRAAGTIQCGGFWAMVNDETVQWKLGGFELQVR
jgi:hypothetical protein